MIQSNSGKINQEESRCDDQYSEGTNTAIIAVINN